jgi:hypothetical protein
MNFTDPSDLLSMVNNNSPLLKKLNKFQKKPPLMFNTQQNNSNLLQNVKLPDKNIDLLGNQNKQQQKKLEHFHFMLNIILKQYDRANPEYIKLLFKVISTFLEHVGKNNIKMFLDKPTPEQEVEKITPIINITDNIWNNNINVKDLKLYKDKPELLEQYNKFNKTNLIIRQ